MNSTSECSNVIAYLEEKVKSHGNKVAVALGNIEYTFLSLYQTIKKLSSAIDCENMPIVIFADRSIDTVLFSLAVVYSGNYYIPIDPDMPENKMHSILEEVDPAYIFCSENERNKAEVFGINCNFLGIESSGNAVHYPSKILPENPLYMVYTSGSTGKPKGVLKTHGAMISFIESYVETFNFCEDEIIGNQTPFFFDASAKDLYLMLRTGARLEIIPSEMFVMPPRLISYLNEKKISYICWVPTALVLIAQMQVFKYILPKYLKRIHFVGEVMPTKYLNYWIENLPHVRYVNLYGQSEICGIACYYEISEILPANESLPIGKPLSNCTVILRDEDMIINDSSHSGEIWIASKALAQGYYKNKEMTERDFVWENETRYFCTGDYAYYDKKGCLVFAARKDSQIKHMGRRIELGEIETAASVFPDMERCCCLYDSECKRIVLFCQAKHTNEAEIRSFLNKRLASYMVPGKIVIIENIPLNSNGKIDRQKLKDSF